MKENQEIKVDYAAYAEELKKQILETGRYARLEVIVPKDESIEKIYTNYELTKCSPIEEIKLIESTEEVLKTVLEKRPFIKLMRNSISTGIGGATLITKNSKGELKVEAREIKEDKED